MARGDAPASGVLPTYSEIAAQIADLTAQLVTAIEREGHWELVLSASRIGMANAEFRVAAARTRALPEPAPVSVPAESVVYFIGEHGSNRVKIGTSRDVKKRMQGLQGANGASLELLATIPGDRDAERIMHQRFAQFRLVGEWFHLSDPLRAFINERRALLGIAPVSAAKSNAERKRAYDARKRAEKLGIPVAEVHRRRAETARENGKKGGRPRKFPVDPC